MGLKVRLIVSSGGRNIESTVFNPLCISPGLLSFTQKADDKNGGCLYERCFVRKTVNPLLHLPRSRGRKRKTDRGDDELNES